jgi:hypothetical protein
MAFPRFGFFQVAALGVISRTPLGVARSCIECRSAARGPISCHGFGEGCLVKRSPQPAPDSSRRRFDKA